MVTHYPLATPTVNNTITPEMQELLNSSVRSYIDEVVLRTPEGICVIIGTVVFFAVMYRAIFRGD